MEVTTENFDKAVTDLKEILPTCSFIAIDEEMTGIQLDNTTNPAAGDDGQARYKKMSRVASSFQIMQFGVCVFHKQDDETYLARPYNFYIFPEQNSGVQIRMGCSTAAFHRTNNMDFNKWCYQGIPFMHQARFDALSAPSTPKKETESQKQKIVLTREDDKAFTQTAMDTLKEWLDSGEGTEKEIAPSCNNFLRRFLYQEIEQQFPDLVLESRETDDKWRKTMWALRLTEEQKKARTEEKEEQKRKDIDARAGFLRVFWLLCSSKKPIVGHNLLYDLLFMLSHFQGPLPDTVAEAKATLHSLMPTIWDTKMLSVASGAYPDTMLEKLYDSCKAKAPAITFAEDFERYAKGGGFHEAGYDAYTTGVCFLAMEKSGEVGETLRNRCYMMRSIFMLRLDGEDEVLEKGCVWHLSKFPPETNTSDLLGLFGDLKAQIRWIDDTSAFAVLREATDESVKGALEGQALGEMVWMPLAQHLAREKEVAAETEPAAAAGEKAAEAGQQETGAEKEAEGGLEAGELGTALSEVQRLVQEMSAQVAAGGLAAGEADSETRSRLTGLSAAIQRLQDAMQDELRAMEVEGGKEAGSAGDKGRTAAARKRKGAEEGEAEGEEKEELAGRGAKRAKRGGQEEAKSGGRKRKGGKEEEEEAGEEAAGGEAAAAGKTGAKKATAPRGKAAKEERTEEEEEEEAAAGKKKAKATASKAAEAPEGVRRSTRRR